MAHYLLFMRLLLLVNYLLGRAAEELWHPADACSHSFTGGPASRAGAHLHEKYINASPSCVTAATGLFVFSTLEAFWLDFAATVAG